MKAAPEMSVLRKSFVDICRGYSVANYQNGQILYVKHLSHQDHLDYDLMAETFKEDAIAKGAANEIDRLAYVISTGVWSQRKEDAIDQQKDLIIRFEDGKKHIAIPSMIKRQEEQIQIEKDKLNKMVHERAEHIGMTSEIYAYQRLNDHYIIGNLFIDRELQQRYFSESSFDDFSDSAVDEIVKTYNLALEPCSDANMKKLSVQDFFIGYYAMCGDNLSTFFGRPVVQMTYHQIKLGNQARYYKSLMENNDMSKIPVEKRNDPQAIEQAFVVQKNSAPMIAEGKVPVGMTKDDIKELGLEGQMSKLPSKNMNFNEYLAHMQRTRK